MKKISDSAALVLIDVQKAFLEPSWGQRNNPQAESRMLEVLQHWRSSGRPVVHIQHLSTEPNSSLRLESSGAAFQSGFEPIFGEAHFTKTVNSAFIGTPLEAHLREHGVDVLILMGLTTDHCVSTTARMAGNLGFETFVLEDATATFERTGPQGTRFSAQYMHDAALASLHGEFAQVLSSKEILQNL